MIGYLTGKLISSKPTQIILDVNGVGYLVNISISTFEKISDKDIVSLSFIQVLKKIQLLCLDFLLNLKKKCLSC